ncbi:MAG: vitamin K epoxide reductase family protein [Vicinamibacterales bacterium]
MMTARTRRALLALAALGLGASAWSSYVHYALLTRAGYSSVCDINSTISCTQAYLSEYGSFWGIPVALAGVLFFTIVLLLVGPGGRLTVQARDNVPAYVFALSTIGLAFVLYLAWASFFKLNALCLLCAAVYVAVIGIFIVSGASTSFPMTTLPRRASRDVAALVKSPIALLAAALCSVGFVSLVSVFPRAAHASGQQAAEAEPQYPPLTDQQKFQFIRWYEVQPTVELPVDAGGAKVVIVKFNDFQCPACRQTYLDYRAMLRKYEAAGQVKYVLKHFPLEPECNASVPGGTHRAACEAAAATVMAEKKGMGDKLEDWLFANLPTLTRETVKQGAAQVAGISDFDAQYTQALTQVRADADLGTRLQVNSTPTYFINGRKIADVLPTPYLEAAIEHELKRQTQ